MKEVKSEEVNVELESPADIEKNTIQLREEVKALYAKYNRTGVIIIGNNFGGVVFSWVGLSMAGAVQFLSQAKQELCIRLFKDEDLKL